MNRDIGQNFILDYWITNNDETINYSSGQETLLIGANSSLNVSITISSPDSAGTYKIRARVSYIGGPDISFDSFEVTPEAPETPANSDNSGASSGNNKGGGSITGKITQEIVCNPPYIRYGKECCLDTNNNSICDPDESAIQEQKNETKNNETTENFSQQGFSSSISNLFSSIGKGFSSAAQFVAKSKIFAIGVLLLLVILSSFVFIFRSKITTIGRPFFSYTIMALSSIVLLVIIPKISLVGETISKVSYFNTGIISMLSTIIFVIILLAGLILILINIIRKRKNKLITTVENVENIKIGKEEYLEIKPHENIEIKQEVYTETSSKKNILLRLVEFLSSWKNKKYPSNSVQGLMNKEVYSESGHHIGKINDIIIRDNIIESLRIKLDGKYDFRAKGIFISYRQVKSVSEVMIIDEKISEHL
jgi:sporulation protein YlmC with PRC-barrel domain